MIPYQPQMRPALLPRQEPGALREPVGLACPVCRFDVLAAVVPDLAENADGSADADCPNCRAHLRQNREGFVFLRS